MYNKSKEKEFYELYVKKTGVYEVYPDYEYYRILASSGILNENRQNLVLDAGCGSGAFSIRLAKEGFKVIGIDLSEDLIRLAQTKTIENLQFHIGDILKIPFSNNYFDLIFCGAIIHHLPDKISDISKEFNRVLKSGGKIYFFEPYAFCINSFLWYNVLKINRTENEKALDPSRVGQNFIKNGFTKFHWDKIKRVEHVSLSNSILEHIKRFASRYVIPNIFFVGSCEKL